jgi:hypothetical protein
MEKKWYQQPYVWFLISIPATSVVLSMVLIFLAVNGRDPMVVDDYYRKGKAINEVLMRDKMAAEMGLIAVVQIDNQSKTVNLDLQALTKFKLPEILELKITHATLGELDKIIRLYQIQPGKYQGQFAAPTLQAGNWYIELGTKKWRLTTKVILPSREKITLQASH